MKVKFEDIVIISTEKVNKGKLSQPIVVVDLENIKSGSGILDKVEKRDDLNSTKTLFREGDVLFGKLRPYLKKFAYMNCSGACSSEIWVFRPKISNLNSKYLFYLVQTENFLQNANKSFGSKMPRSDWKIVSQVEIELPSLPEQERIAGFLSLLDERISKQEEKIELLKKLKQGYMQKLFTQELRFRDDNGNEYPEWEEKRLEMIGNLKSGQGFPFALQGRKMGAVPFYKVSDMNIIENHKNMIVANNYLEYDIAYGTYKNIFLSPTIIFAKVGAAVFLERKRICRKPFLIDNNMMAFIPNIEICTVEYAYHMFTNIELSKYSQTGSLPSLNAKTIAAISIPLPSKPEQTKIASFLDALDEKIDLETKKLGLLRQQKQGYMQQLFA